MGQRALFIGLCPGNDGNSSAVMWRGGRVSFFGCAPGCLISSLLLSVALTILLNLVLNVFGN